MEVPEQIIFLDKFFRDVREFDASVFRMGEMGLEVFLKNVEAGKSSARTRDDAVRNQFDCLKGASFGICISGVDDVIDPEVDSCAVFFHLVGFEFI